MSIITYCYIKCRLEAYDRNENFGGSGNVYADADDWHMQLPPPQTFRDVTTKDKLPLISSDTIAAFLNHYSKSLDATARELYTAR